MKIHKFIDFLLEYNNKNTHSKVLELAKKYPNIITTYWDPGPNTNYLLHRKNKTLFAPIINNFESQMTPEFIADCNNIGIPIEYILEYIWYNNEYSDWILIDNNTLKICPGGGKDYLSAKILGKGMNKIAYQSKDYVLKRLEDVSSFELYISNKYPDTFATYELAGNMVKQEKLISNNEVKTNLDIAIWVENIIEHECFNYIHLDVHEGNIGLDKNGETKCFDFVYGDIVSTVEFLKEEVISLDNLISYKEIDFIEKNNPEYKEADQYKVVSKFNPMDNSLNFIDPINNIVYLNHTYREILPVLQKEFILFGIKN
jgi:hypothetical protein